MKKRGHAEIIQKMQLHKKIKIIKKNGLYRNYISNIRIRRNSVFLLHNKFLQWIFLWEELVEYLQTTMQWHSESNYVTCVQKTQYDSEIVDVSLVFCANITFFWSPNFLLVSGRWSVCRLVNVFCKTKSKNILWCSYKWHHRLILS